MRRPGTATSARGVPPTARVRGRQLGAAAGVVLVLLLASLALVTSASPGLPTALAPNQCAAADCRTPPLAVELTPAGSGNLSGIGGWVRLSGLGVTPGPRFAPAMVYDPAGGFVLLFGGASAGGQPLGDTWEYAQGSWTNVSSTLSAAPPARWAASMAFDARSGDVMLFGGQGSTGTLGDTWAFTGDGWEEIATAISPSPRYGAGLAPLPASSTYGDLVLFGGRTPGTGALADTWFFSATAGWRELLPAPAITPAPRSGAILTTDLSSGATLLFGGSGRCGRPCGDTWVFSQGTWANRTVGNGTFPAARTHAAAAYDPRAGGIVMSGGEAQQVYNDTWLYRSGAWTNLGAELAQSAPPRAGAAMTFDSLDGYLLTVGGHGTNRVPGPVWALQAPLTLGLLPGNATIGPGSALTLTAAISGGVGPYRVVIDFGDGTPSAQTQAASHTYLAPGVFRPTATVTDALGRTVQASGTVRVVVLPLEANVTVSPAAATPGITVSIAATVHGGATPYALRWTGLPPGCSGGGASGFSCRVATIGTWHIDLQVRDAGGATVQANATLTVAAAVLPTTATASPPAATMVNPIGPGWALVPAVAAAAVLAAVAAALYFRAARLEAAARRPRPLCLTVPEWSETPDEFGSPMASSVSPPPGATGNAPLALAPTLTREAGYDEESNN